MTMSDKLYEAQMRLEQTGDTLSLITDSLQIEQSHAENDPACALLLRDRLDTYFSGYSLMLSTIQAVASTLGDIADLLFESEAIEHG